MREGRVRKEIAVKKKKDWKARRIPCHVSMKRWTEEPGRVRDGGGCKGFHSASVSMCVSSYILRRSCNLLGYRAEPESGTGKE